VESNILRMNMAELGEEVAAGEGRWVFGSERRARFLRIGGGAGDRQGLVGAAKAVENLGLGVLPRVGTSREKRCAVKPICANNPNAMPADSRGAGLPGVLQFSPDPRVSEGRLPLKYDRTR
jgi:hypothetical protein